MECITERKRARQAWQVNIYMFILLGSPNAKRQICGLMIPILWKRAFFNRWHHANCDQCLGTYVGRPRNCTTKGEKSKVKGLVQRALAVPQWQC